MGSFWVHPYEKVVIEVDEVRYEVLMSETLSFLCSVARVIIWAFLVLQWNLYLFKYLRRNGSVDSMDIGLWWVLYLLQ